MSNLSVTKVFQWEMAHMLADYEGDCKNLHGHSYKMEVTASPIFDASVEKILCEQRGMVVDFKELKKIVQECLIDKLDHAFVYWKDSPDNCELQIAEVLKNFNRKVVALDYIPTAENMVFNFIRQLNNTLINQKRSIRIVRLVLWETSTSYVEINLPTSV